MKRGGARTARGARVAAEVGGEGRGLGGRGRAAWARGAARGGAGPAPARIPGFGRGPCSWGQTRISTSLESNSSRAGVGRDRALRRGPSRFNRVTKGEPVPA